ncbi:tail fiber domain-containing protein [Shewanella algae]|uniref:tail fiber domain-containing protein n=1 Tax=Shewanella algae TaxID=38313 RepID=UPI0030071D62
MSTKIQIHVEDLNLSSEQLISDNIDIIAATYDYAPTEIAEMDDLERRYTIGDAGKALVVNEYGNKITYSDKISKSHTADQMSGIRSFSISGDASGQLDTTWSEDDNLTNNIELNVHHSTESDSFKDPKTIRIIGDDAEGEVSTEFKEETEIDLHVKNSDTADKLTYPSTVRFNGDVQGELSEFDGSQDHLVSMHVYRSDSADKLTHNSVVELEGKITGRIDLGDLSSPEYTASLTVEDYGHRHTIEEIDDLQDNLDAIRAEYVNKQDPRELVISGGADGSVNYQAGDEQTNIQIILKDYQVKSRQDQIDNLPEDLDQIRSDKISRTEQVTYTLDGGVTGTVTTDADSDVTIATTVQDDSHQHGLATLPEVQQALDDLESGVNDNYVQKQTPQTIRLIGDVSGSVTSTKNAPEYEISVNVKDDSHNHVISNVDGLQSELDSKVNRDDSETIKLVGDVVGEIISTQSETIKEIVTTVVDDSHNHNDIASLPAAKNYTDELAEQVESDYVRKDHPLIINIAGDASGSYQGSHGDEVMTVSVQVQDSSHKHIISNIFGLEGMLAGFQTRIVAVEDGKANKRQEVELSLEGDTVGRLAYHLEDESLVLTTRTEIDANRIISGIISNDRLNKANNAGQYGITTLTDNANQLLDNVATTPKGVKTLVDSRFNDLETRKIDKSIIGQAGGIVPLDSNRLIDPAFLPDSVDEILEYPTREDFPEVGETKKVYIALDTMSSYRWSGSVYVKLNDAVSTAETATRLETKRKINGVDFDGTEDISINLNNQIQSGDGISPFVFDGSEAKTVSVDSTVVRTDDPRLSDKRDPNEHVHPISDITGLQQKLDQLDSIDEQLQTEKANLSGADFTGVVHTPDLETNRINDAQGNPMIYKNPSTGKIDLKSDTTVPTLEADNLIAPEIELGGSTLTTDNDSLFIGVNQVFSTNHRPEITEVVGLGGALDDKLSKSTGGTIAGHVYISDSKQFLQQSDGANAIWRWGNDTDVEASEYGLRIGGAGDRSLSTFTIRGAADFERMSVDSAGLLTAPKIDSTEFRINGTTTVTSDAVNIGVGNSTKNLVLQTTTVDKLYARIAGSAYQIYHTGFKPNASDVGLSNLSVGNKGVLAIMSDYGQSYIGMLNDAFTHYDSASTTGHYFYKNVQVQNRLTATEASIGGKSFLNGGVDVYGLSTFSDNIIAKKRLQFLSSATDLGGNPQIWHDGRGSVGDTLTMRAMRESINSTITWEKYRNGEIQYSTGSTPGGTNTIVINPASGGIAANKLYAGANANSGYFFSDVAGRTAFTGGDFYIQESTTITRIFSPDIRLGSSVGGNISISAGTAIRGAGYTLETSKLTMSSTTQTRRSELNNTNLDISDTANSNASGVRYLSRNDGSVICGFGSHWNGTDDTITTAFAVGTGSNWYGGDLFKVTKEGDTYAGGNTITKRVRLLEPRIETDQPYVGFFTTTGLAKSGCMGSLTVSNDYSNTSDTPAYGIYSAGNIRTSQHVYTTNSGVLQGSWNHNNQGFIDIQNTSTTWAYNVWSLNGGAGARMQVLGGSNTSGGAARLILNNSVNYDFRTNYLATPGYLNLGVGHIVSPGALNGTYGSISINGHKGGYAGIHFDTPSRTFMVGTSAQGIHTGSSWQWYFSNGVLTEGYVPYSRVTGAPTTMTPTAHTHSGHDVKVLGNYLTVNADGSITVNNESYRQAGMYGIYNASKIGHIWSMGTAYRISPNGSGLGNLYGAAYCYQTKANYAGGHQFLWTANGQVNVALGDGGVWTRSNMSAYSDIRVKSNIEKIDNALDKIVQISGYTYNRTDLEDTATRHSGVIAQEVQKILPEVVSEISDGEDGTHLSVNYSGLIPLLIEGIKEQKTLVENQSNEIEDLKQELETLKTLIKSILK